MREQLLYIPDYNRILHFCELAYETTLKQNNSVFEK